MYSAAPGVGPVGPDGLFGKGAPRPPASSGALARPVQLLTLGLSALIRQDFNCRPSPLVWALTAGLGGALTARRPALGSSPARSSCPSSDYDCQ